MKIDILCGQGSSDGVTMLDLHGEDGRVGVGGSEYALLTMCEAMSRRGDEVTLYNNPKKKHDSFEQRQVNSFSRAADRDFLIVFREPTAKASKAKGKKIFWSCDQFTRGDFKQFSEVVDQVVTISPFHKDYFSSTYGIESDYIDLPVRTWEYSQDVEKVKNRLVFTSVPDRGLDIVAKTLPIIQREIPDVSLVVTSDYRLWGSMSPNNSSYVTQFLNMPNVEFLGGVGRKRLIEEQLKAQIHYYPFGGQTEELFCVAVAESQVAGTLPITSSDGALGTTNMGVVIDANARDAHNYAIFANKVIEYLRNPELAEIQKHVQEAAKKRFDIENILDQWDEKVFNG